MPSLIHKRPDGSDKKLEVSTKPLIIGRLPESEIQVRDGFISRVHAGISYANNAFVLKDLGSTNGTYRNGARVFECDLSDGDKIQVGNTTLVFEVERPSGDGILRQIPQMATAPRPLAPPRPAETKPTIALNVPSPTQPPNPPSIPGVTPT
jgi:pSer/pThr/pTyr-binding forkhead associated (FHA) protein